MKVGKQFFTHEIRTAILTRTKQVGAFRAAIENNISVRIINRWLKAMNMEVTMAIIHDNKFHTPEASTKEETQLSEIDTKNDETIHKRKRVRAFTKEKRLEIIEHDKDIGYTQAAKEAGISVSTPYKYSNEQQFLSIEEIQSIIIENAVLKEKIIFLSRRLEYLRLAVKKLLS